MHSWKHFILGVTFLLKEFKIYETFKCLIYWILRKYMKFQNYKIFREEVNKGPTAAVLLLAAAKHGNDSSFKSWITTKCILAEQRPTEHLKPFELHTLFPVLQNLAWGCLGQVKPLSMKIAKCFKSFTMSKVSVGYFDVCCNEIKSSLEWADGALNYKAALSVL